MSHNVVYLFSMYDETTHNVVYLFSTPNLGNYQADMTISLLALNQSKLLKYIQWKIIDNIYPQIIIPSIYKLCNIKRRDKDRNYSMPRSEGIVEAASARQTGFNILKLTEIYPSTNMSLEKRKLLTMSVQALMVYCLLLPPNTQLFL